VTFFRALPRRLARLVIYLAAAAMADWSLYVVAHDIYGVPKAIAVLVAGVFDGAALACLDYASKAVDEARSAAGPRIATLGLAGASIFLNVTHARHIGGGLPAALLFASPTAALLVVSDLSWAAARARVRAARGEKPLALPVFGAWGWMLAGRQAWATTKARAVAHVSAATVTETATVPERHSASEVLRRRFAEMDPADAVRIAHDAHPDLPPGELAALLVTYGVIVDAVQVALVLGHRSPAVEVERADDPDAGDAQHDAAQVGALPAPSKAKAILDAASALGRDATAADVAARVERITGLAVDAAYVRTVLSRQARKPRPADDRRNGGYL